MVVVNRTESPVLLIREHTGPQSTQNISRPPPSSSLIDSLSTVLQLHVQSSSCLRQARQHSVQNKSFRAPPFQIPAPLLHPTPLHQFSYSYLYSALPRTRFFLLFHVPSPFTAHTYGLVFKRPVSGISDHPWKITHFWDVRLPRLPFRDPTYFHNISVTSSAYRIMQSIGSNRTATTLSHHLEGCR